MATHSSILAWAVPTDREAWQAMAHSVEKSRMRLKRRMHAFVSVIPSYQVSTLTQQEHSSPHILPGFPSHMWLQGPMSVSGEGVKPLPASPWGSPSTLCWSPVPTHPVCH